MARFEEEKLELDTSDEDATRVVEEHPKAVVEEARRTGSSRTPAFIQPPAQKGSSINRKALESTNRGKRPSSRRFVRGILHPSPFKMGLAAVFVILIRFALIGAVILGTLVLLEKVEPWLAWFLLILPLAALCYFATVGGARCRVCGAKEFIPSGANKHVKTHRFLFSGPIMSTALHLLLFRWFHCMFCGTAIRTKK